MSDVRSAAEGMAGGAGDRRTLLGRTAVAGGALAAEACGGRAAAAPTVEDLISCPQFTPIQEAEAVRNTC